jgi:hypothetical protein
MRRLRRYKRYLRRYISRKGSSAHARTFCLWREFSLTQTTLWLLLATQGVDHLSLSHDKRKHTPLVQMADRRVLPTDLYPVAPGDAPEQEPYHLQLLATIVQQLEAQVETLSVAAAPIEHTTSAIPTADSDRAADGRLELHALPYDSTYTPQEYIDHREWSDFASRTLAECLPPSGTTVPCV